MFVIACIAVALLYFGVAVLGVMTLSLPSGIVMLWPPNAVLLAGLLSLPRRYWALMAALVVVAEVLTDYPAFPIQAAVYFGLINAGECLLAALLIARLSNNLRVRPNWNEPRDVAVFVLVTFFVASPVAALHGAAVYLYVLEDANPYIVNWRLWWFGDAAGVIALTPALHMLFNIRLHWAASHRLSAGLLEWIGLIAVTAVSCYLVFSTRIPSGFLLALLPLITMLTPLWAAVRLGPLPGAALAAAVVMYAAIEISSGQSPFAIGTPEATAGLVQEVTVLFVLVVLFTAALQSESRRKSGNLRLYKSAVEATGEGVLITEAGGDQPIIYCNPSFQEMTGYAEAEILGKNCRFLNRGEPDQPEIDTIRHAIHHNAPVRISLRNYRKDGALFWNKVVINPIVDERGKTTHFVGVVRDISRETEQKRQLDNLLNKLQRVNETLEASVRQRTAELQEANEKLERLALTDELTGVDNRRNLIRQGHLEVLRCRRTGGTFAVMLFDIDHFKKFNDDYGHEAGDLALQAFAHEVQHSIRKIDSFGRWGGEEFMVLVYGSDQIDLRTMGNKILQNVAYRRLDFQGQELTLTASLGIATWQGGSFDETVSMADRAMYRAKSAGRNRLFIDNIDG